MPSSPDIVIKTTEKPRRTRSGRVVEPAGEVAPEDPKKHIRPHQAQGHDRVNSDGELIHVLPDGVSAEDVAASSQPHE